MSQNQNLFSFLNEIDTDPMIKTIIKYAVNKQMGKKPNKKIIKNLFENPGFFSAFSYGISKPAIVENIIVSKNYAVFQVKREGGYCGGWTCNRRYGERFYIVGVNPENNKLFTEYRWPVGLVSIIYDIIEKKTPITTIEERFEPLRIYTTNDKIIQRIFFDYEIDSDLDPNAFRAVKMLTFFKPIRTITIRAQGDLLLTLILQPDQFFDYENSVKRVLLANLIEILEREIATRISNVLSRIGLNPEIRGRGGIAIRGLNPNDDFRKIAKIIKWLKQYVIDNLNLEDIFDWLNVKNITIYEEGKSIYYEPENQQIKYKIAPYFRKNNSIIEIEFEHIEIRVFGNPHGAVLIGVRVNADSLEKTPTFQKIYEKIINSIDYRETKTEFGRHKITVNALPTRITTKINTPMGERTIVIDNLPLKVFGEIKLEHPEHKTKKFIISTPTIIEFATIQQEEIFAQRINKHILNEIYRQIK